MAFTDPSCRDTVSGVDFEDTYNTERSKLMRFLMSVGASQHEADDAVQEAFADAYAAWDTIREPRAWIFKAALRTYYRGSTRARSRETPVGDLLPDQAEHLNSGEIAALNEEERAVEDALASLPVRQRQVYDAYTCWVHICRNRASARLRPCSCAAEPGQRTRRNLARYLGLGRRKTR